MGPIFMAGARKRTVDRSRAHRESSGARATRTLDVRCIRSRRSADWALPGPIYFAGLMGVNGGHGRSVAQHHQGNLELDDVE